MGKKQNGLPIVYWFIVGDKCNSQKLNLWPIYIFSAASEVNKAEIVVLLLYTVNVHVMKQTQFICSGNLQYKSVHCGEIVSEFMTQFKYEMPQVSRTVNAHLKKKYFFFFFFLKLLGNS